MKHTDFEILGITDKNINVIRRDRISWDQYFMEICNLVSQRSHDAQTQHGCVLVKNKQIISTGYNGFPAGSPDDIIPNIRNYKYPFIIHAEESAILNAAKIGVSIKDCIAYITGMPCSECAKKLVSVGILHWIIGDKTHISNEEQDILRKFWITTFNVKIIEYKKGKEINNDKITTL